MHKNNLYPVFTALAVAIGGFLLGFDGVVNGGAVPFYRVTFGISDSPLLIGLSSSAIILGAIFGNLSIGYFIDKIGRKPALIITSILFMIGAGGTAIAPNIILFIISKLIAGLGVGIAILAAPLYIAEIAPPKQRGWLVTFNQLNIVLGLSVAMLSNYYLLNSIADPDLKWRWMLGVGFFPAAIYFFLLFLIPESPRWLIMKGRDEEGKKILKKIGGETHAESEFKQIKNNLEKDHAGEEGNLKELFSKKMRYILFVGIGLAIFQQLSGINAVLYYAPMIFESAGTGMDSAFLMAIVVGAVFTVATIISMFLIDKMGRRPLLIIGCSIMALSFLLVSFSFKKATYQLDKSSIQSIEKSLIGQAFLEEGKKTFPKSDSSFLAETSATFYKNGEKLGDIPESVASIQNQKKDFAMLTNVLLGIENKIFEREVAFFDHIKSTLISEYPTDRRKEVGAKFSESYKTLILNESISIDIVLVLLGIVGFIAGFSISLGPVMWAMFSEIFPTRIRSKAIAFVGAINAFTSFIVATWFPFELEYLGSSTTYLIFGLMMIACLVFVYKYVPETKEKSLEELELELVKG